MGTWGTGIFEDDTASDVRGDFEELIENGCSGTKAREKLEKEYEFLMDDSDDAPIFWLALAAAQMEFNCLELKTQKNALRIIETGASLDRWEDEPILSERNVVLEELKNRLIIVELSE